MFLDTFFFLYIFGFFFFSSTYATRTDPILTLISDAMTKEGELRNEASELLKNGGQEDQAAAMLMEADTFMAIKNNGNVLLQKCSAKYGELMKELREKK